MLSYAKIICTSIGLYILCIQYLKDSRLKFYFLYIAAALKHLLAKIKILFFFAYICKKRTVNVFNYLQ